MSDLARATGEPSAATGAGAAGPPMLEIRGLGKRFGGAVALGGVDLQVSPGEFLTLLGPSGSGKTTMLRIIVGFEQATDGQVLLRGRDISRMSPADRGVGMVFQQYALFPHMTVDDNIGYGLRLRGWPRERRRERVEELLRLLRLHGLGDRYPRQLSGGQQQRVALGRALAYDPEIILMDEPLGALDRSLRIEMEAEIRRIHRDLRATIIYVTHDQQEALALSDRIAIMRAGAIVGLGTPKDLFTRPPNSFVASFFSTANLLPVESHRDLGDGTAAVGCLGAHLVCPASSEPGSEHVLAVRRRSLRRAGGGAPESAGGDLRVAGVVRETLLFGDERQLTLEVPEVGEVIATVDARDSHDIDIGDDLVLRASAGECVLVPRT